MWLYPSLADSPSLFLPLPVCVEESRQKSPLLSQSCRSSRVDLIKASYAGSEQVQEAPLPSRSHNAGGVDGTARYCKKCREVFYGEVCRLHHANFVYTKKIPPEVAATPPAAGPPVARMAPAPASAPAPMSAPVPAPVPAPARAAARPLAPTAVRAEPQRDVAAQTQARSPAHLPVARASSPAAPLPVMLAKRVVDARNPAALLSTPEPVVVTTQLTLSGSLVSVAGSAGSIKRRSFEKHFAADVAATLSAAGPAVSDSQISIVRIAAGSIIVTFEVRGGTSGTPISQHHVSAAFATVVSLPKVGASTSGPPAFPLLADMQAWPALEKANKPMQPATHAVARKAVKDANDPGVTRSRHPSLVVIQAAHKARDNWWLKADESGSGEKPAIGAHGRRAEVESLARIEEADLADSPSDLSPGGHLGSPTDDDSPAAPEAESDDAVISRTFAAHRRRTITAMDVAEAAVVHTTSAATDAERQARMAAEKHVVHCEAHDDHIDHEIEQAHREIAELYAEADAPKEISLPSPERHALFSAVDLRNDSATYRDLDATPDWQVESPPFAEHSEIPVSTHAGGSSDHLTVHVATWNLGNAAPPEHLNRWL
eukprot:COSAG02_NODE_8244_length_2644_cov_2.903733_1_plen_600_part_01